MVAGRAPVSVLTGWHSGGNKARVSGGAKWESGSGERAKVKR